jgi:hypothetical protein
MEYKGKRVKIINFDDWDDGAISYHNYLDKYIGVTGIIIKDYGSDHRFVLKYDDDCIQKIDDDNGHLCFKEENIELLDDTYIHIKQPKPPLGVMPKHIYELQRVKELCRALYERSIFEEVDYELMIKWSDELNDRLYNLKGDDY